MQLKSDVQLKSGGPPKGGGPLRHARQGILVEHLEATPYRRPGPVRRVLAIVASGGIGVLAGVIAAIAISFAVALAVIWMTNLLQQ